MMYTCTMLPVLVAIYLGTTDKTYLSASQSKETFLQEGILPVPQCEGETEPSLGVAESHQPILPPLVGCVGRQRVTERLNAATGEGKVTSSYCHTQSVGCLIIIIITFIVQFIEWKYILHFGDCIKAQDLSHIVMHVYSKIKHVNI